MVGEVPKRQRHTREDPKGEPGSTMQCVIIPDTPNIGLLPETSLGLHWWASNWHLPMLPFLPTPQQGLVSFFHTLAFLRAVLPGLGKQHVIRTTLLLSIAQIAYDGLENPFSV